MRWGASLHPLLLESQTLARRPRRFVLVGGDRRIESIAAP